MDGRDIGTVVLPRARVKIFLTAAPEARAERRLLELRQRGQDAAFDTVLSDIIRRDEQEDVYKRQARLGMTNSRFANPSGLNAEGHCSTARDLALLARACLKNETLAAIAATRSITLEGRSFVNHNKLLWRYGGCVGLKTGYTEKAGRTLVSAAERDGMTLIAVTLDDPDDWRDHAALFDWGKSLIHIWCAAWSGCTACWAGR